MTAYTIRKGQRGKVVRLRTNYDMTNSTARRIRISRPDATTLTIEGVPFDQAAPGDLLWTVAAGQLDEAGTYPIEIEIEEQQGDRILKCDEDITIEVTELAETI